MRVADMRDLRLKRIFDLAAVILTLPLWLPVFIVIALLVRLKLGVPVLFHQKRPGYRTEIFELIKFRTMRDNRDTQGRLLPDEARLTPFGRWLRATSLDELPELINVLCGEMSLVGPRPLLVEYLGRYTPEQTRRHGVLPGLTGWCQINGRNALTWEQKFALDVWYVEHRNLWLDLKILLLTLGQVIARHGISAKDHATMPEFKPPAADGKAKVKVEKGSEAEEGRQAYGTTGRQD
jgi:lipopolysaccharide/colanic/teichoic acid biosynthesis glycosyltransferase